MSLHVYFHISISILLHLYEYLLLLLPLSRVIIKKNRNSKSVTHVYCGASRPPRLPKCLYVIPAVSFFFFFIYFTIFFSLSHQIRISRPHKLLSFRFFFSSISYFPLLKLNNQKKFNCIIEVGKLV